MKNRLFLLIILVVATFLRLYNLETIPVGFNDDEAAFGYNAYSILRTGRDEWGQILPFPAFESFGDWKLVGLLYPTALTTALFGLNEFSTRLPSAIFGIVAVLTTYLLASKLFDKKVGLLAALFLAISPWHVIASRNAFESDPLVAAISLSTYLFLIGLTKKRFLTIATISFGLSFYIYRSSWLFLPLFLVSLGIIYRSHFVKNKTSILINLVLLFILLVPLIPTVLTFKGQSRFLQESFISGVSRSGLDSRLNETRGACSARTTSNFCLIYNKYFVFLNTYLTNYGKNLSFQMFFDNASPTGFQSFATRSVFYLFEFPLIYAGIALLVAKKSKSGAVLISWILLVPVGAAIAGSNNYGRINLIMPAPQIIAAFAAVSLISLFKTKFLRYGAITVASAVILLSFYKFLTDAFFVEPYFTSREQRYGYKELFSYLKSKENNYDNFYISKKVDNSHQYIQYVYFSQVDPKHFQKNAIRPKGQNGWVEFAQIGKYHFTNSLPKKEEIVGKPLFVTAEKEVGGNPTKIIRDLRGDPIFEIHEALSN